ncbi:MAG: PAS domain S-box protein [Candidatus Marinimicrobia bacterium]|nr:PAS domain S-box protein [Candidatus Neomarinimicrobiota bacterium]
MHKNILAISHNQQDKQLFQKIFDHSMYSFRIVPDLASAKDCLNQQLPAVLILSLDFAEESFEKLKCFLDEPRKFPIVALLDQGDKKGIDQILAWDIEECLIRPFSEGEVLFRIEKAGKAFDLRNSVTKKIKKLTSSENKFRSYVENNPDGFFVVNDEGKYLEVNPAACKITGYTAEELLAMGLKDIVPEEDSQEGWQHFQWVKEKGFAEGDLAFLHKNGEKRYWRVTAVKINDRKFIGFARDITEQQKNKKALLESEEKHRLLVENTGVGIGYFSLNGEILFFNQLAAEYMGGKPEDYMGRTIFEVCGEKDGQTYFERIQQAARSKQPIRFEDFVSMPTGQDRWFMSIYSGIQDSTGSVIGVQIVSSDISDLKVTQLSLMKSERNYRQLIETASDSLYVMSDQGKIIEVNKTACETLGYERGELLQLSVNDVDVNFDRQSFLSFWEKNPFNTPHTFETLHKRKDGRLVPVEINGNKYKVNDKVYYLGFARDISDRKKSEQAIRETTERFTSLVKHLQSGVFYIDTEGNILETNPALIRILGSPSEEATKKINIFTFQPLIEFGYVAKLKECIHKGEIVWGDGQYLSKWGKVIFVSYYFVPIWENDRVKGVLASIEDVSELKKTEAALKESEKQKNIILNSTTEMVAFYDANLSILWANKAAADSMGLAVDTMKTNHCYELWQKRKTPCHECPVLKARDTKQPCEKKVQTPDGKYWLIRAFPIFDEAGEVVNLVEFGMDITASEIAVQEQKKLQEKLIQAQKMESVGRLAGGIAHDFNNMLSVIIGNSEIIMFGLKEGDPVYDEITEIYKAAMRSADLTRQLLAFARKQTISPEILNINQTVNAMMKMLERLIGENIELIWKPDENLQPVKIDPTQVDQILTNLIVNAKDAIQGIGKVVIQTQNVVLDEEFCRNNIGFHTSGDFIKISISDSGKGMDKETLSHVFEPFFTTKEIGKGTGLGLSTIYGIVKQNNGYINVYSEPGTGTTFSIFFPVFMKEGYEAQPEKRVLEVTPKGNETILLVEDEIAIIKYITKTLKELGYKILVASSPAEALDITRKYGRTIDLMITDVVMPQMNGRELAKQVLEMHSGIKQLFISGYTADVIAHHGIIEEGVNFLHKPFTLEEISKKVRLILDN